MAHVFHSLLFLGLVLGPGAAMAKSKSKTYESAKKECLKEDPILRGKALQKCIFRKVKK